MRIEALNETTTAAEIDSEVKSLLSAAFAGDFTAEDWDHAQGGMRWIGSLADEVVAHGAVVARRMWIDGKEVNVGYVEAIAVLPKYWRQGFGTILMKEITNYCEVNFELSMLSTDEKGFYRTHGWREFPGKSFVLRGENITRSADEDAGLMYLSKTGIELLETSTVLCEERFGDSW